jgi:hypothetical protein
MHCVYLCIFYCNMYKCCNNYYFFYRKQTDKTYRIPTNVIIWLSCILKSTVNDSLMLCTGLTSGLYFVGSNKDSTKHSSFTWSSSRKNGTWFYNYLSSFLLQPFFLISFLFLCTAFYCRRLFMFISVGLGNFNIFMH